MGYNHVCHTLPDILDLSSHHLAGPDGSYSPKTSEGPWDGKGCAATSGRKKDPLLTPAVWTESLAGHGLRGCDAVGPVRRPRGLSRSGQLFSAWCIPGHRVQLRTDQRERENGIGKLIWGGRKPVASPQLKRSKPVMGAPDVVRLPCETTLTTGPYWLGLVGSGVQ